MSVRAYKRITSPTWANQPTFNLWQETELVNFLQYHKDTIDQLNEGSGVLEVSVKGIKEAIKEVKLDPETKKSLEADIEGLSDEDFVTYECF